MPALACVEALAQTKSPTAGSLTEREVQVLKLVAQENQPRDRRQTRNQRKDSGPPFEQIFNKLDLSSRAAATAYAYQNQLV